MLICVFPWNHHKTTWIWGQSALSVYRVHITFINPGSALFYLSGPIQKIAFKVSGYITDAIFTNASFSCLPTLLRVAYRVYNPFLLSVDRPHWMDYGDHTPACNHQDLLEIFWSPRGNVWFLIWPIKRQSNLGKHGNKWARKGEPWGTSATESSLKVVGFSHPQSPEAHCGATGTLAVPSLIKSSYWYQFHKCLKPELCKRRQSMCKRGHAQCMRLVG